MGVMARSAWLEWAAESQKQSTGMAAIYLTHLLCCIEGEIGVCLDD